jgi:hypothetical protein
MESHLNESELAVDDPVDPGLTSRTYMRRRKSRKHLKILYRKHLNLGGEVSMGVGIENRVGSKGSVRLSYTDQSTIR